MLERFKVPTKDQVFVGEAALRKTVAEIFLKMGLTHDDAAEGAEVLTVTDLRGVETHGVSNMLRQYVREKLQKIPSPFGRGQGEGSLTRTVDPRPEPLPGGEGGVQR